MTQRIPDQQPWEEMLRQAFTQPREAAAQFAQGARTPAEAWRLLEQLHSATDNAVDCADRLPPPCRSKTHAVAAERPEALSSTSIDFLYLCETFIVSHRDGRIHP